MRRRYRVTLAAVLALPALVACGGESTPTIAASPTSALADTPFTVSVGGLSGGSDATVRLTTTDRGGVRWSSQAVFRADGSGRFSSAQAPVSGDYSGADPMGLVEVLSPGRLGATFDVPDDWTMTVAVVVHGRERAHVDVTRRRVEQVGLHVTDERPATSGIYGELFLPATVPATPTSAVVVMGGSEGGLATTLQAAGLAARGHPALALAYFDEPGLPTALANIPLEYFAAAAQVLAQQPGVDPGKIVLWGTSRGSEAALLTAAYRPDLIHGVIGAVPGAEAYAGFPVTTVPAWTFGGVPVPTAPTTDFLSPSATSPFAIPVEKIDGPMLLVCGTDDEVWNSCENVDTLAQRLTDHGITRRPTELRYAGAGHFVGSLVPYLPSTRSSGTAAGGVVLAAGGTYEADQAARAKGWPALLAWLAAL